MFSLTKIITIIHFSFSLCQASIQFPAQPNNNN
ncbi:hypothetical protein GLYMA_03G168950v4 [Glycine max]|nr:hypothetical protein GLYMA_03G168950v4 [Glycine max]KAH1070406.1 hypothetical protein GYH30_007480 [Glycine max]